MSFENMPINQVNFTWGVLVPLLATWECHDQYKLKLIGIGMHENKMVEIAIKDLVKLFVEGNC
jgi:hypothetical protein